MPRTSLETKLSKKRKLWDKEEMKEAVTAVREKKMGLKRAANQFRVLKTTLRRLALDTVLSPENVVVKKLGRKPILPECLENELVDYLLLMEAKYYGFTRMDVRKMAFQLAVRNGVKNPFGGECAGRAWFDHFIRRHRDKLAIRKPTGTSYARAKGFSRETVAAFYDIL